MRKILSLICGLALLAPLPSLAQSGNSTAKIVASCGSASYTAGTAGAITQDTTGKLCGSSTGAVTGTVTANQGTPNVGGATSSWPVQGAGVAGTPAGGVASVQGVSGGTNLAVSQATAANLNATVVGNVGGYEFNASVLPTTTNASHAAGVALADLQTISIGSTNSLSGILTQVQYASKGGSTSGVAVYVWSKNPAATTCTNGSAIVTSQADNEFLAVPPLLLTPALVLSATDTTTYAAASNLVGNFVNGSSNTNLYVCLVANATQTPATTSDIRLNIQGIKDQP